MALHEARLIFPPLMTKETISLKASADTRRIAKLCVHVDRLKRKLKCFGILRGVIPLTLKPYANQIVKVCAMLVNLQPSAIKV